MSLFGKKSKENAADGCCGGGAEGMAKAEGARVKILGTGCAKCDALEASVKAALEQLGMDAAVDHVTDFSQIAAYGVMTTPALVVDGRVVSLGKALKTEEAVKLLEKIRG